MEYKVLMALEVEGLEEQVNEMLRRGWVPCGGVAISAVQDVEYHYQAMIKK